MFDVSFFLGMYIPGFIFSFLIISFFYSLDGKDADLWKALAYSSIWPISIPIFIYRFLK